MARKVVLAVVLLTIAALAHADNMDRFCINVPDGRFVSSPRSCQHWIFCQQQKATEGVCPGIYQFDQELQMCRYPDFVQCDIDAVDIECPIEGLELHPHPQHCDQYVACVNGFPRIINCAPGLLWDNNRETCDIPQNVECVEPEIELDYQCQPNEIYVTRHPHDCQAFIICDNGHHRINRCADSLLFDPENLRCDFAPNVNCNLPEAELDYECDPNVDFYFAPHPTNCEYYIICLSGMRQVERCANGLIFDWLNRRCDLPEVAICQAPPS